MDGFNLQLWSFTPEQPCRKLWSLPLFKPPVQDEANEHIYGGASWLTCEVNIYETTDSSLLIVHGRSDVDRHNGYSREITHQFAVCPGTGALVSFYSSFSSLNNSNGSGGGGGGAGNGGASLDQTLHMSTAHFVAISSDQSLASRFPVMETVLEPEVSIMEIPELVPTPCAAAAGGDGGGAGDGFGTPTTVAIGINHGSMVYFAHVRLGLPSSEREGWTTYTEQYDPKGTSEQRQKPLDAKASLDWRSCWGMNAESGPQKENIWILSDDMRWQNELHFKETSVARGSTITAGTGSAISNRPPRPPRTEKIQQVTRGLHIAVRMPALHLDFDAVLSAFLTRHKLSISCIDDYYTQRVVDTGHCVHTTEDVLATERSNAFNSNHYFEIPCVSSHLPNEPGLVFAVVVKFHDAELKQQLADCHLQNEHSSSDHNEENEQQPAARPGVRPLFKTGIVTIFAHTSAMSGISHIMAEFPIFEFKDPKKPDLSFYQEPCERNKSKPPLQVFQEKLAVSSSFENSLMVLSNSKMIREQGSLSALYHPVLPQWLIGFNQSIERMQKLATDRWKTGGLF